MQPNPDVPIAISLIGRRYFLFSADLVAYLRREHRICGVLIGSIPQIPQQNVFLGVPLELMPEEANLLVEKGVSFVVDDRKWHLQKLSQLDKSEKMRYLQLVEDQGRGAAATAEKKAFERTEQARKKPKGKKAVLCETEESQSATADDFAHSLFTPPLPSSSTTPSM